MNKKERVIAAIRSGTLLCVGWFFSSFSKNR